MTRFQIPALMSPVEAWFFILRIVALRIRSRNKAPSLLDVTHDHGIGDFRVVCQNNKTVTNLLSYVISSSKKFHKPEVTQALELFPYLWTHESVLRELLRGQRGTRGDYLIKSEKRLFLDQNRLKHESRPTSKSFQQWSPQLALPLTSIMRFFMRGPPLGDFESFYRTMIQHRGF